MYYCATFCLAAASNEEKVEIIEFAIHSSNNLTEEGKRGRELTKSVYSGRIEWRTETNSTRDALFTMEVMGGQ